MKTTDIPEDIRAEMDGKGAQPQTFSAWMDEQTPEERERLFGARNAKRFESGEITQTELLRQHGNALPLRRFAG